jgi:hypothetical protein
MWLNFIDWEFEPEVKITIYLHSINMKTDSGEPWLYAEQYVFAGASCKCFTQSTQRRGPACCRAAMN